MRERSPDTGNLCRRGWDSRYKELSEVKKGLQYQRQLGSHNVPRYEELPRTKKGLVQGAALEWERAQILGWGLELGTEQRWIDP